MEGILIILAVILILLYADKNSKSTAKHSKKPGVKYSLDSPINSSAVSLGRAGEKEVIKHLTRLPKKEFYLINDLTVPSTYTEDNTQIDSVVFSPYGIFVIEVKNMSGWIFGAKTPKKWTQVIFNKKTQFQNPFRQNYKHISALRQITKLPLSAFQNLVVFTCRSEFKSKHVVGLITNPAEIDKFIISNYPQKILQNDQLRVAINRVRGSQARLF